LNKRLTKEALRLAFEQHKEFAVTLKGTQREREISEAFSQSTSGEQL